MQRLSNLSRRTKAALTAALALGLLGGVTGSDPASADPKQFTAAIGVGSDTTQDVVNAFAGFANGTNFTPVQSTDASKRQVVSWDALGTPCITPKAPGATFLRPNGSTNGRRALSRAIDGAPWGDGSSCGGNKNVAGLVQFARSSAGPSGTGTNLTYIPFGRDGMSFAYYAPGVGTPVTTLTSSQLNSLFTAGPQTINGVQVVPCSIQLGSGTYQFWNSALGVNATQMAAATASCTPAGQEIQENDANGLKAKGDALGSGKQYVIGFSAANFISQTNGVAGSQLPSPAGTVDLGSIDSLGKPYTGPVAGPIAPSSTFYASTTYGRNVYNVLPTSVATGLGNADLKSLFVGASSAVCSATGTIQSFGFLPVASCGSTTLQGPLVS